MILIEFSYTKTGENVPSWGTKFCKSIKAFPKTKIGRELKKLFNADIIDGYSFGYTNEKHIINTKNK